MQFNCGCKELVTGPGTADKLLVLCPEHEAVKNRAMGVALPAERVIDQKKHKSILGLHPIERPKKPAIFFSMKDQFRYCRTQAIKYFNRLGDGYKLQAILAASAYRDQQNNVECSPTTLASLLKDDPGLVDIADKLGSDEYEGLFNQVMSVLFEYSKTTKVIGK